MSLTTLSLEFSAAEMLYLKDALRLGSFPGGTSADIEMTEDTANIWRLAGLNALRARGLVQDDHESQQMVVDRTLAGILMACVSAHRSIFVDHGIAGGSQKSSCLHLHDVLSIVHRRERLGIDHFIALFDPAEIPAQFRMEIPLNSTGTAELGPISAPKQAFLVALDSQGDAKPGGAVTALVAAGVSDEDARALVDAFTQPYPRFTVMALAVGDEQNTKGRFWQIALIDAPEGVWVSELAGTGSSDDVTFQRVAREQAYAKLEQLLAEMKVRI